MGDPRPPTAPAPAPAAGAVAKSSSLMADDAAAAPAQDKQDSRSQPPPPPTSRDSPSNDKPDSNSNNRWESQQQQQRGKKQQHEPPPASSTAAQPQLEEEPEYDDFGLPVRKFTLPPSPPDAQDPSVTDERSGQEAGEEQQQEKPNTRRKWSLSLRKRSTSRSTSGAGGGDKRRSSAAGSRSPSEKKLRRSNGATGDSDSEDDFKDAHSKPVSEAASVKGGTTVDRGDAALRTPVPPKLGPEEAAVVIIAGSANTKVADGEGKEKGKSQEQADPDHTSGKVSKVISATKADSAEQSGGKTTSRGNMAALGHSRELSTASTAEPAQVSEFSHQQVATKKKEETEDDGGWQEMPSFAPYDIYDDDNKLIAKEFNEDEDETQKYGYAGLGGAGKGYTRLMLDDDAESANSMDDNTQYLFKNVQSTSMMNDEEEEHQRDAVSQLQATKDLLTEGQRVAYVGLTRLEISAMIKEFEGMEQTRKTKKEIQLASESMQMWAQKMMIRLYAHMEINAAEQVMIEQLSSHGVVPADLTPVLMANARVKNPMAESAEEATEGRKSQSSSSTPAPTSDSLSSPRRSSDKPGRPDGEQDEQNHEKMYEKWRSKEGREDSGDEEEPAAPPPPYQAHPVEDMPGVKTPTQLPSTKKIDIDLRWTVLCDLFLVLIADSIYDARSRCLLERVAKSLEIPWLDICRFEKKVTDALEMQQNAEKENWNEEEHMENRRKMALKRRYVMMGLATVGGGLVIGLSAGLLAPVIGMGLAAGFSTIGIAGTNAFLAGAGGAAIITSSAAASGSVIGVRAADRRTGSVKTFEYRPLHNNKRVNLIITISGWMTGKVDDVRLPFSTVDSIMGDIYSVLWEPDMLTSMGDTINILATEALTQGLQQVLASTILTALMAALQLPVILSKLAYLIDNPWAVSLDRATAAGLILADSLIDRNLGTRPVTLVGYSLGSRVIYSCLQELARKGALGLIQNVYLFGSPVVVNKDEYLRVRTVVSGRFLNGYNRNDWILGYLFRLTNGGIRRIAGLAPVEGIPGLENMDVSEFVEGHMSYRTRMPRLLRECGWLVESDEFTEIEDPDPENHAARQRELINEIEEARKELEKEAKAGKSGGFFSFARKKKTAKKEWEIYEDSGKQQQGGNNNNAAASGKMEGGDGNNHGVLFDVDAIRAELAKEAAMVKPSGGSSNGEDRTGKKGTEKKVEDEVLQVRELQSTLPPIKLDLPPATSPGGRSAHQHHPTWPKSPRDSLRGSQSADALPIAAYTPTSSSQRPSYEYRLSEERTPAYPSKGGAGEYGQFGGGGSNGTYGYYNQEGYHHNAHDSFGHDNEIQMTFDTSFDDDHRSNPPPPVPMKDTAFNKGMTPTKTIVLTSSTTTAAVGGGGVVSAVVGGVIAGGAIGADRPPLASSQTVPDIALADPWADGNYDDDDDDFGKEQEISMTFA